MFARGNCKKTIHAFWKLLDSLIHLSFFLFWIRHLADSTKKYPMCKFEAVKQLTTFMVSQWLENTPGQPAVTDKMSAKKESYCNIPVNEVWNWFSNCVSRACFQYGNTVYIIFPLSWHGVKWTFRCKAGTPFRTATACWLGLGNDGRPRSAS